MNSYQYRITVEALTDASGKPLDGRKILSFQAGNHDDLLGIVQRVRCRNLGLAQPLDEHESAAMIIGMKIFSEVALAHRKDAFFAEIREALGRFVRELKSRPELAGTPPAN